MSAIETYSRTLARAAQLVGGADKLAERLGVPVLLLQEWMAGRKAPPQRIFLAAVDIVMDHSLRVDESSAKGSPPGKKKSGP